MPVETSYPLHDLAQTIAHHQSFDPYELAREILAYDNPGHVTVVGLSNSLKLVCLYHLELEELAAFRLSERGIADVGIEAASFRTEELLRDWVQTYPWRFGWIHPRYR